MKQISIIGYLGNDAEVKEVNKKFRVQLNVAVTEKYQNEKKETIETTDWFTCFKTFKDNPESFVKHLVKGTKVYANGKPNFALNNTAKGVYMSLNINLALLEIVSFVESETKES